MSAFDEHVYDADHDGVIYLDERQGRLNLMVVEGRNSDRLASVELDARGARQLRLALTRWEKAQK